MLEMLYIIGIIFVVFLVSFGLINIRYILIGKEFRGTCSTNNPMLKDKLGSCTVCGKKPEEACKMPEVKSNTTLPQTS